MSKKKLELKLELKNKIEKLELITKIEKLELKKKIEKLELIYKNKIDKLELKYKNKIEKLELKLENYQTNINKIEELNEKFLSLIEIKIMDKFKINFDYIYNNIIDLDLFKIENKDAFYIREFLFQKIYRYVIENFFNGNKLIKNNLL